jgi:hypothetical protein
MLRSGIERMLTASGFDAGLLPNVSELRTRDIVAESQFSLRKVLDSDVATLKQMSGLSVRA